MESYEEIIAALEGAAGAYSQIAADAVTVLKTNDPELYALALDVLGSEGRVARWFAGPTPSLYADRPWERLARGDRQAVRDVLLRIAYGIYS